MDSGSLIIGIVLIAVCILPFVIIGYGKKKRKQRALAMLNSFAVKQKGQISQHEICGDFVIGIDEPQKLVFFMKKNGESNEESVVNLHEIQKCELKHNTKSLATSTMMDKIELKFIPIDKNKKETLFRLFDTENNMYLGNEMVTAEKWAHLINESLKQKK